MVGPLSSRVLTTTNQHIIPKAIDTVLRANVFATRMLGKAKKWNGERMLFPIKYAKNTTGTSFSGFDTFAVNAVSTRDRLTYYPSFYRIGVTLPTDELSVNATDEKVLSLIDLEVKSAAQDMADDIGTLFYSDGTGNANKDFLGLGNLVDDSSAIGGLSRSTYSTLQSTNTASGGTLSLAKMSTLYNAISDGAQTPTVGLVDYSVFSLYEQLLTPQERVVKDVSMIKYDATKGVNSGTGLIGGAGYTGLFFKGFPVLADRKATAQTMFFLNEDFLDFYALPMFGTEPVKYSNVALEGNDYDNVLGLGFSWSGWKKPINQASIVGDIYLGGQLITENPRRHGKLTGIASV